MASDKAQSTVIPPWGPGGEQTAAAPTLGQQPSQVRRLRNGLITGPGVIEQTPDWALAATATDGAAGEDEGWAGIFPLAEQGDAGTPGAGVGFSFDLEDDVIRLHQLNADGGIIRSFDIIDDWVAQLSGVDIPPQITAADIEGVLFFCPYGREPADDRHGMGYFDPLGIDIDVTSTTTPVQVTAVAVHPWQTGARVVISGSSTAALNGIHTITRVDDTNFTVAGVLGDGSSDGKIYVVFPAYAVAQPTPGTAATLKFRGVAKHRGGTILGWGYLSEEGPTRRHAAALRWCKYTNPFEWVRDITDTSAGFGLVGTPGKEIVGVVEAGNISVVGKATEVYAFYGDYNSQFGADFIGKHGPVSTVGMASDGELAVWMTPNGPAFSDRGAPVRFLGTDRVRRRMARYIDFEVCWAAYDSARERFLWTMRRQRDDDGVTVSEPYPDDLLIYDRAHDAFYVRKTPTKVWSIGVIQDPGLEVPGPSAAITQFDAASNITVNGFRANWTAGDTSPGVTYRIEYAVSGTATWILAGETDAPQQFLDITGLNPETAYKVRGTTVRNGKESATTASADPYATTLAEDVEPTAPTSVSVIDQADNAEGSAAILTIGYTPNFDEGMVAELLFNTVNNAGTATEVASGSAASGSLTNPFERPHLDVVYHWVRFRNAADVVSDPTASSDNPYTVLVFGEMP